METYFVLKTWIEIIIPLILFCGIAMFSPLTGLVSWWKRAHCEHTRIHEDGSCTAWCRDCGKNLGFIGSWQKKVEENSMKKIR